MELIDRYTGETVAKINNKIGLELNNNNIVEVCGLTVIVSHKRIKINSSGMIEDSVIYVDVIEKGE